MITKQIIKIKLHFDNPLECEKYQTIYKKKGYIITSFGLENGWYFEGEKVNE